MPTDFFNKFMENDYPYIIADIGANHNGNMELAKKMIESLSGLNCDAAKFQSWTKNTLFNKHFYKEKSQFVDKQFGTLEQMVEKFSLSESDHIELKNHCDENSISFCSSVFSYEEADMLEKLDVPFFKIASMDLNNPDLLAYVAKKNRTIILSTGMGTLAEIDRALNTIYKNGNEEVILLHCVSIYPPKDEMINLNNMITLNDTFDVPVGFSDHSIGYSIPLAAIAMGAVVIEKHFTLDKKMAGWDHAVSADESDMNVIINEGRRIIAAKGSYQRRVSEEEMEQRKAFRRSVVANGQIKKGTILRREDLDFKRPGRGVQPNEVEYLIGRTVNHDIQDDELIMWEDIK